jgi:hypothetical protein
MQHGIDRSEVSRALAKALAHKAAGNDALADEWGGYLLALLGSQRILARDANTERPAR